MLKYNIMSIEKQITVLKDTIAWFKKQIEPHDCGWMYTTIDGLKHRISVLRKDLRKKNGKKRV
tara:strand:+ start:203 stop:391 length:189 start_codon:yes stop_codon:yes gene_type:complete